MMSEVLQANIFFLIASIATLVFCLMVMVILFQVYKITRLVRSLLERIDIASETVAQEVAHVRQLVTQGGLVGKLVSMVFGSKHATSRTKKKEKETTH
jgi:hypothetical protein